MKIEQGKLIFWENKEKKQVVWMVCDDEISGIVIHSDGIMKIGTITPIDKDKVKPFIGTVNISSAPDI
jgi:hypothetical protein